MRCKGCRSEIETRPVSPEAVALWRAHKIEAIGLVRKETGLDLKAAKGLVLHLTKEPGRCHHCGGAVDAGASLCAACGRVNLDW
jgi:hypothetical protein